MATLTTAEIANRVLEILGAKAAGQPASAEDMLTAEKAVVSAWHRLRNVGKAPYEVDAVPAWAWQPLPAFIARDLVNDFGLAGERLQSILASADAAEREMARQCAKKHDAKFVVKPCWY